MSFDFHRFVGLFQILNLRLGQLFINDSYMQIKSLRSRSESLRGPLTNQIFQVLYLRRAYDGRRYG